MPSNELLVLAGYRRKETKSHKETKKERNNHFQEKINIERERERSERRKRKELRKTTTMISWQANNHVHVLVLLGGLVVLMGFLCEACRGQTTPTNRSVSAMFVLGDSSVDCGDNALFYSQLHRNLSLLPCNASHHTLLPYLLAEKMALPYALPFYNQNGSIEDLTRGLNFGSAQATIMNPGSQGYQSLNQQLRQAAETVQLLHLQLSEKPLLHFVRSSVFFLSFGKDDYITRLLSPPGNSSSDRAPPLSPRGEFARILVAEMERAMRSLHDMRIRRIVCVGILPLGCTPQAMMAKAASQPPLDRRAESGVLCSERINGMVLEFNVMMEEKIVELNAEFRDARIVFFDVFQGITKIVAEPQRYGFEEAQSACCGVGSYGAEIGCLSVEMACGNGESHVWWDQYNPTRAVNALLADSAWSGQPFSGLSRPMTIQELVSSSPPDLPTF